MSTWITFLLILFSFSFECRGEDSVTQPTKVQTATAGETVTIDCTYKTNAFPTLYWYQYKANQAPKYMLKRYAGSSDEDEDFKERFNATLQTSSTSVPLTIQDVRVSDSAVYYCALQPTVTETHSTLIQKHNFKNCT
uniref:T-cell receptor alpha/delta variable 29.0 n=1 Tax=Sinocyclocheilus grahami TaxID=75366 RepID=A0A672KTZ9_SINGR